MTLTALQPPVTAAATHGFADRLAADRRSALDFRGDLRTAAQQLVASTLVMPMLAQMQDDPFRSDLFHGGSAEDMFNSQLNIELADRIVAKANFPIVDQIYQSTIRNAQQNTACDELPGVNTHA